MCNNPEIIASGGGFTLSRVGESYRITTAGRCLQSFDCEAVARLFFDTLTDGAKLLIKPTTPCPHPESAPST
jgi:hypothetical protein